MINKKQFGGKLTDELKKKYASSPQWLDGEFKNLEHTSMSFSFQTLPKLLYKQFFDKAGREPESPLPVAPFEVTRFLLPSDQAKMIWYGHSACLMRIKDKTLLVDPMLGPDAAPIAPFKSERYSKDTLAMIDHFPEIDLLLLTHDHYDHLDLASIEKLIPKVKKYFVALGASRHFEKWGVERELITEFDWWQEDHLDDIRITFTPSRHFSGRGLGDRNKSLWGGWVIRTSDENIYWSGDGGYGSHFKEVGKRLGPFDFGLMECGQYNENWHQIHMFPEESVQAAIDAGAKKAMPVHWGSFSLAQHTWWDPVVRFAKAAKEKELRIITPALGDLFSYIENIDFPWWEEHK